MRSGTGRAGGRTVLITLMTLLLAAAIPARPGEPGADGQTPARGRLVEHLTCQSDSTQTYTLYLPSSYSTDKRWPALLVFDPRGRSVYAAEIFRRAAQEYGWLILSSDNTRSDGPWEPNDRALRAMWPELFERWSVDPARIYAAGFSGGAMAALALAEMTNQLAGIIGAGGRIPDGLQITEIGYAHFGAAGLTDFNYGEMWKLDALLAARGNPHRMEIFEGRHQWLPEELALLAIEWLEVQAMKQGTRIHDNRLLERLYEKELSAAAALEKEGRGLEALWRYDTIARTFGSLLDISRVVARSAALTASPAVKKAARNRVHWDAWERRYFTRLGDGRRKLMDPELRPSARQIEGTFGVNDLKRRATRNGYESVVAGRVLERIWTHTSFYMARDLLAQKRYSDAMTALSVAVDIRDDNPYVWYNLACAAARAGSKQKALQALEEALHHGFADIEHIRQDSDLRSLHQEPRFLALIR